jgi:tetratricopeptide (TPR) repeat protein
MKYLDFDLVLAPAEQGYRVQVSNSPAGNGTADIQLPFSEQDLKIFRLETVRTRGVRRMESAEMRAAREFGGRLFQAVFAGDVGCRLQESLDRVESEGSRLRLRVHLSKTPELANLPWEYLYESALGRFLALSVQTPVVRYLELPERIKPLPVKPPVRVLVMIASPKDKPPLDVEGEWSKLTAALAGLTKQGLVEVDRLAEPTFEALQKKLRRKTFHIFHFVGHGEFDEECREGMLLFEDEDRQGAPVTAQALGMLLHDETALRLAILNACEGARASSGDPFAGTAQTLLQQGIPAVIAMQSEITDEAAQTLARTFYESVADGYPVDAALTEARKSIYGEGSAEWGTPVLYMRSPDGRIFDIEQRLSEEVRHRQQVAVVSHEAEEAIAAQNWAVAVERLQRLAFWDPADSETAARLQHARLKLSAAADDQSRGKTASEPPPAVASRPSSGRPKNWAGVVQIADLYHEADQALAAHNWPAAIEKLQRVLEMDPAHPQAKASLDHALQQRELAELYALARRHTDEKNWREAVEELRRVRETDPNFQDVKALLERARRELDREERERDKAKSEVQPPAPASRKISTSLKVGGCAVAATVTLCSVLVVGVMLRQQGSSRATAAGRPPVADRASEPSVSDPKVAVAPPQKEEPAESAEPKPSPEERALLSVIREAANAEIQAGSSWNPAPLSRVYTGAALLSELASLQFLQSNGMHAVARLGAQKIDSFRLSPDGRRAEVEATETWTVRFVSALNGACVGEWPTYQISHTYFLGRGGTGWMIDAIQHHNQPPAMQPCGG